MPKLSPTMEVGTITKWKKHVGDRVRAGDVLFEVATDKSTVEHSALDEGYLRAILVKEGEEALVNQAIAIFTETEGESIEGYQPEGIALKKEEKLVVETSVVSSEEKVVQKESKPAFALGMKESLFAPQPPLEHYTFPYHEEGMKERVKATPLARKIAEEKGLDLSTLKGTGPHDRIVSRDLSLAPSKAEVSFGRHGIPQELPGTYEEISLSPVRKVIAERMQQAKMFVPHFYLSQEVNAEPLVAVRQQLKEGKINVSFNDLILRGVALSLRKHPEMNVGYHASEHKILHFKTIDISIAVSVEAGLITPIIRHADYKNVAEISAEVKALVQKAREGSLKREEYIGGSFTVSNLGMYGISEFVGIINPPQAALLAIGGIEERPVIREGAVVPGKTLRLTLSCDHRVLDGALGAIFLKAVQHVLENPALLLI